MWVIVGVGVGVGVGDSGRVTGRGCGWKRSLTWGTPGCSCVMELPEMVEVRKKELSVAEYTPITYVPPPGMKAGSVLYTVTTRPP